MLRNLIGSAASAPLLALSAILAIAYGAFGSNLYAGEPPSAIAASFKASSIVLLGVLALRSRARLLAAGLLSGALGDALLAWSTNTFLAGALAFLFGHAFYIAFFLRTGIGVGAAIKQPLRMLAVGALIAAAFIATSLLVPRESAMSAPLAIYTAALTLMTLASFTLRAACWLAMAGAVLFFISDGFVAANRFYPLEEPALAYWRSFAGWMIYWAGQACICVGIVRLAEVKTYALDHRPNF